MDAIKELLRTLSPSGEGGSLHLLVGTVRQPWPLVIEVAGTDQEAERFTVPPQLVPKPGGPPWVLDRGESVLLITDNFQDFHLIDKVVQL